MTAAVSASACAILELILRLTPAAAPSVSVRPRSLESARRLRVTCLIVNYANCTKLHLCLLLPSDVSVVVIADLHFDDQFELFISIRLTYY